MDINKLVGIDELKWMGIEMLALPCKTMEEKEKKEKKKKKKKRKIHRPMKNNTKTPSPCRMFPSPSISFMTHPYH